MGIVGIILLILAGYCVSWTGFGGYYKISTEKNPNSSSQSVSKRTEEYQREKTLWDWMQLLIVPTMLAVVAYLFNRTERRIAEASVTQRESTDRKIAAELSRDTILETYLDRMSELLLEKGLNKIEPNDLLADVARTRTLTALRRLIDDKIRKGVILNFLYDADLITGNKPVLIIAGVNLAETTLSEVKLARANLSGVNLAKANLAGADLTMANLSEVNLSGANMAKAKLTEANLTDSDLEGADLAGADLTMACLKNANLVRANLAEAILVDADLSEANMFEARLRNANLDGASLKGALVTEAELNKTLSLSNTIMPSAPHT